ncbi:unnamed protein product, partial [Closterium sp. NIES-65]
MASHAILCHPIPSHAKTCHFIPTHCRQVCSDSLGGTIPVAIGNLTALTNLCSHSPATPLSPFLPPPTPLPFPLDPSSVQFPLHLPFPIPPPVASLQFSLHPSLSNFPSSPFSPILPPLPPVPFFLCPGFPFSGYSLAAVSQAPFQRQSAALISYRSCE